jgi:hypothetical protein
VLAWCNGNTYFDVLLAAGKDGIIIVTYDVLDGSPSVEQCKLSVKDYIMEDGIIKHGNIDMFFRETVHLWNGESI